MTSNPFIDYIKGGKIRNLDELKRAYRKTVMRTHPDAIGSDRLVEQFIELSDRYEEAKVFLESMGARGHDDSGGRKANHRLSFFRILHGLEYLEMPYNFKKARDENAARAAREEAFDCFGKWKPQSSELYRLANREYDGIRAEKPRGPYRKDALYANLRPVFHNIIAYHLTGARFYQRQVKQNLEAVMLRLVEREAIALKEYLELLIDDMWNGPAIFD